MSTFAPRTLRQIQLCPGSSEGALMSAAAKYTTLEVSIDGNGIASIALNRPSKQNAQSVPMWNELADVFQQVSADPSVRVAILSGNGGNFCSGMDLSVFAEMKALAKEEKCEGRAREQLLRGIEFFQAGVNGPELCSKPVLCALDGNAIGGGVDLATACDMRYTTDGAKISVREVDLGIVADIGTMQRLPFLVGDQRAREVRIRHTPFKSMRSHLTSGSSALPQRDLISQSGDLIPTATPSLSLCKTAARSSPTRGA